MSLIRFILILSLYINQVYGCRLDFIAEYGNTSGGELTPRSAASYGRTVRFTTKGLLYWFFITQSTCNIDVLNVFYTNDGPADNLTVYINENYIGSFQTVEHSREGVFWNKIVESGLIGRTTVLQQGNHTLNISVVTVDIHGVEIDKVTIGVPCDDDLCSVQTVGQPSNVNNVIDGDSNATTVATVPGSESSSGVSGTVAAVVVVVVITTAVTGVFIAVVSLMFYRQKHNSKNNIDIITETLIFTRLFQ